MLTYTPMKNFAGIRLSGDYTTLRSLHETIHRVADEDRLESDSDILMALAYDIRKAYDGQRDVISAPQHHPEMGVRYGVKIIWPMLLLQSRQLRTGLSYMKSNSGDQAMTYALEAVIEAALKTEFADQSDEILAVWQGIHPTHRGVVPRHVGLCAMFCSWTKAERRKRIVEMLRAFDPMHDIMQDYRRNKGEFVIASDDIDQWSQVEWADPERKA